MNAFAKSKSNQLKQSQSNPFKKSSPIIQSNEQKRVTDRTATLTSHSKQEARYLIDLIANGIQGDLFRGLSTLQRQKIASIMIPMHIERDEYVGLICSLSLTQLSFIDTN
jgi:hypothetical protein